MSHSAESRQTESGCLDGGDGTGEEDDEEEVRSKVGHSGFLKANLEVKEGVYASVALSLCLVPAYQGHFTLTAAQADTSGYCGGRYSNY